MNDEEFLREVLNDLEPKQSQVESLLRLRDSIRSCINDKIGGKPSMFMAGSFKKNTMIKQHYDLDMFLIWSSDFIPLEDLFYKIEQALHSRWKRIEKKRVGWRIPYENEFHVDVIPSIQDVNNSDYSYLYNCYKKKKIRTSMTKHIDEIEKYNRRDVIKLLKLWKYRRNVPIKTFLLEVMIHLACYNLTRNALSVQLEKALKYISNNINREFYDPANRENIITEYLIPQEREKIRKEALKAINREYWGKLFENIRFS